jgi:cell division inhibitor SulA
MIDKKTQAAEARRILALHPKELGLELAKQSGLPQTKILEILRRQAADEDKKR